MGLARDGVKRQSRPLTGVENFVIRHQPAGLAGRRSHAKTGEHGGGDSGRGRGDGIPKMSDMDRWSISKCDSA